MTTKVPFICLETGEIFRGSERLLMKEKGIQTRNGVVRPKGGVDAEGNHWYRETVLEAGREYWNKKATKETHKVVHTLTEFLNDPATNTLQPLPVEEKEEDLTELYTESYKAAIENLKHFDRGWCGNNTKDEQKQLIMELKLKMEAEVHKNGTKESMGI